WRAREVVVARSWRGSGPRDGGGRASAPAISKSCGPGSRRRRCGGSCRPTRGTSGLRPSVTRPARSLPACAPAWRRSLPRKADVQTLLRALPGVDAVVTRVQGHPAVASFPRRRLTEVARDVLAAERRRVLEGAAAAASPETPGEPL